MHDRPQAQYSERGPDYIYNMQRLLQKVDTARLDVMVPRAEIMADYAPGEAINVAQHDGLVLRLHKLAGTMIHGTASPP